MKRAIIFALMICSLFLLSCAPTKYVCQNGNVVADPAFCVQVEEKKVIEEILPADPVKELMAKSKDVESLSYDYKRVDKPLEKGFKVWVQEVAVKQELPLQTEVLNSVEMDTVIFDTLAKTANAYCQSKKYCIKTGDIGAVEFDKYYIKTPLDWIDGISSAEKKGEARLANRDVWILELEGNVTMYVDTFFGVPLRVDNGQERHEFQNMIFNGVTDEQVQFTEIEDRY